MSNIIKAASKSVAEKSMSDAAAGLRKGEKTWFLKILDVSILSKSCKACTSMAKIAKSNPKLHEVWKLLHKCNLNYTGSSAALETAGAAKIFGRFVEKYGLYYTSFYGDDDSKAYPAVKEVY